MKMPRLMSGWVTSDRRIHDTREEAYSAEVRTELRARLTDRWNKKLERSYTSTLGLDPSEVIEVLEKYFRVEPRNLEDADGGDV